MKLGSTRFSTLPFHPQNTDISRDANSQLQYTSMRRFLGANLHINTSSSSASPTPSEENSPALSSTKRAFQHTFGSLSRGSSTLGGKNGNNNNNNTPLSSHADSHQQYGGLQSPQPQTVLASPSANTAVLSSPLPTSSPIPPTPPSKHGHSSIQDNEEVEYDDSSWDDALKLPFGSSIISRASSSASSSNPYEGMIERSNSSSSSSRSVRDANGHESTIEHRHQQQQVDALEAPDDDLANDEHEHGTASRAGHRTSTATISASRTNNNNTIASTMLSPTSSSSHGEGASSTLMLFSNTQQSNATSHTMNSVVNNNKNTRGLQVSATYAANASSLVDLKDEMMLELLSSDALIHVAQFEILGFDEVEELRKVSLSIISYPDEFVTYYIPIPKLTWI